MQHENFQVPSQSEKSMRNVLAGIIESILQSDNRSNCLPTPKQVLSLVAEAQRILSAEPTLLTLTGQFAVVGDIHGNLDSLRRIFGRVGYPPETSFVFLGDYVDRGRNSVEVIILLFALKVLYPDKIYLVRGNHESRKIARCYGFWNECREKYKGKEKIFHRFATAFDYLPLAAILNGAIFCVHGGLSGMISTREDLAEIKRPVVATTGEDIVGDLLWSDPRCMDIDYMPSDRNCGCFFNESALDEFLAVFGCSAMIRAHENMENGYEYTYNNKKCLTLFSSTNYGGQGNSAAVAIVERSVEAIEVFEPLSGESVNRRRILVPIWLLESPEGFCSNPLLMVDESSQIIELF
jgi:diadenosine tetraphosphatase ApaH/serine/threonine PP2A family protein phosphatase